MTLRIDLSLIMYKNMVEDIAFFEVMVEFYWRLIFFRIKTIVLKLLLAPTYDRFKCIRMSS